MNNSIATGNEELSLHLQLKALSIFLKFQEEMKNLQINNIYDEDNIKIVNDSKEAMQEFELYQDEIKKKLPVSNKLELQKKADDEYDKDSVLLSTKEKDFMDKFFENHKILSRNRKMLKIFRRAKKFRLLETILITGEPGTGKEGIAHAIHDFSKRDGNIITVNIAGSVESLEDEFFGHVEGAFTDAIEDRNGAFKLANKGTLFLDEIGDASLKIQNLLLTTLGNKKYLRKGSDEVIEFDFKIICATNRDLIEQVKIGAMRKDFRSRLQNKKNQIHLPPLNERKNDIPILAEYFFSANFLRLLESHDPEKKIINSLEISESDFMSLQNQDWSEGNVRELKGYAEAIAVEYFNCLAEGHIINRSIFNKLVNDPDFDLDDIETQITSITEDEWTCIRLWIQEGYKISKVSKNVQFAKDKVQAKINNALLRMGSSVDYDSKAIAESILDSVQLEGHIDNDNLCRQIDSYLVKIIKHYRPQPKIYSNEMTPQVEELMRKKNDLIH